ncbi:Ubiquitin-fold modifier-conjugating enzyme [Trema orientale]|uniref:Ubiquitin-fold modifier-conjugating enzyme n=1 Tax=Trema orientale TaxID=63057 RepID=A0A2P5F413_TREOI|nr:Ubiquitin-fold modifier-conjugating enzyme [Trema orientale]
MHKHLIYQREGIYKADFPEFCSYGPVCWEDPLKWQGVIFGPPYSPYEGGVFFLSIDLPQDYPSKPPTIKFTTKVFHPNIDDEGTVYVDILEEEHWKPIHTIESLLVSLCSLLGDPDPLGNFNESCVLYRDDREEYYKVAREWTRKYATLE